MLGLGLGITDVAVRSKSSGVAAPTLTLLSAPSVNTPSFTIVGDLAIGDVVRFQKATDVAFATAVDITNTITAPQDAANELDLTSGALADGAWWFRVRTERAGIVSAWSNVVTETIATSDAATTAWVNAVVADGGAVSATQRSRVNTLILSLKSSSLFTSNDRLWLYAGESDAHQAKIDIVGLGAHTVHGTPTLAAGGYTGNGTSDYIDTGFNPATAGGNYAQNSASLGAYVRTADSTYDSGCFIGSGTPAVVTNIFVAQNTGDVFYKTNSATFCAAVITTQQGLWITSRTGANAEAVYRNGNTTPVGSNANASVALGSLNIFSLAVNNNGSPGSFVKDQVAAVFIGSGLSSAQMSALSAALNAYMTAWAVNVY